MRRSSGPSWAARTEREATPSPRAQNEPPSRPTKIVSDLLTTGQSAISMVAMAGLLFTLRWSIGLMTPYARLSVTSARI